ncbi:hypothetical protein CRG98_035896, partial [Punica granatum]
KLLQRKSSGRFRRTRKRNASLGVPEKPRPKERDLSRERARGESRGWWCSLKRAKVKRETERMRTIFQPSHSTWCVGIVGGGNFFVMLLPANNSQRSRKSLNRIRADGEREKERKITFDGGMVEGREHLDGRVSAVAQERRVKPPSMEESQSLSCSRRLLLLLLLLAFLVECKQGM